MASLIEKETVVQVLVRVLHVKEQSAIAHNKVLKSRIETVYGTFLIPEN